MYELFEHTADLGLRVVAPSLDALFADAGRGLFSMIVEEMPAEPAPRRRELSLEAQSVEYLFFDWLHELLYVFDTEHVLLGGFDVRIDGFRLNASAEERDLDRRRQRLLHEVKAITYHQLKVEPTAEGWMAEVIVDI